MRIFKTKWFARFARREGVTDKSLLEAIERAEQGLIDADLGEGLIKLRIARPGAGRSGGYRTIVAYRGAHRAIFLYAFAKSEREIVGPDEIVSFRRAGGYWLSVDAMKIKEGLANGAIQEVDDGQKGQSYRRSNS
ncbi:MAG: type II toxin-antitoxin system RelE/ParE family toxin [Terracidiphilus sp.]